MQKRASCKVKTIKDYVDFFSSPEGQSFVHYDEKHPERELSFKEVSDRDGGVHLILWDQKLLKELRSATEFESDSTFKSKPCMVGVSQLLTVVARVFDRVSFKYLLSSF